MTLELSHENFNFVIFSNALHICTSFSASDPFEGHRRVKNVPILIRIGWAFVALVSFLSRHCDQAESEQFDISERHVQYEVKTFAEGHI